MKYGKTNNQRALIQILQEFATGLATVGVIVLFVLALIYQPTRIGLAVAAGLGVTWGLGSLILKAWENW